MEMDIDKDPFDRSPEDYDVSDIVEQLDDEDVDQHECDVHEPPWRKGDLKKVPTDVLYDRGIVMAEYTNADELYICSRCDYLPSEKTIRSYESAVM